MALLGQGLPVQSGGHSPRLPSVPMMSTIKARTGDRVAIGAPSAVRVSRRTCAVVLGCTSPFGCRGIPSLPHP